MGKDLVICKLDIINPDLIIKIKDIQYRNFEQEVCKNHIKALLDLKVIEPSISPHRTPAFIVNKHSEQKKKGKLGWFIVIKGLMITLT